MGSFLFIPEASVHYKLLIRYMVSHLNKGTKYFFFSFFFEGGGGGGGGGYLIILLLLIY